MRVALLHDDVLGRTAASPDELGVLEAVEAIGGALGELGHVPVYIAVGERAPDRLDGLEYAQLVRTGGRPAQHIVVQ